MRCKFDGIGRQASLSALLWRSLLVAVLAISFNTRDACAQASDSKPRVEPASVPQPRDEKPAALVTSERGIPFKRDEGNGIGAGMATATAVGLLLLGIWVSLQFRAKQAQASGARQRLKLPWLGRFVRAPGERSLRVLESAPLTAHARLHVVAWRGTQYLISTSAEAVHVLDRAELPAAAKSRERK